MKALGFDQRLADQTKTALRAMFGSVILRRLLDSGGCGEDVELAVCEDAVDVEEKKLDFPGTKFGGWRFGHRRDSSIVAGDGMPPSPFIYAGATESQLGVRVF